MAGTAAARANGGGGPGADRPETEALAEAVTRAEDPADRGNGSEASMELAPELPPWTHGGAGPAESGPDVLPTVEELAARIPPEVQAAMDELFRAKWTVVKRLRESDLKRV